jgi:chromosome segregation ATPase
LDAQERELRTELRQIEEKITGYAVDMNAEELGRRISPTNSGRAGAGPRYEFAKRQRDVYEAQRQAREREIAQLHARREELRTDQRRVSAEAAARREQDRTSAQNHRDELQSQIDSARTELKALETSRVAKIEGFRRKELSGDEAQKQKDDPLARMTAYQELKNDPKDGATIIWFSWMTKLLVIFLEVVPVVAKMFFSPPSVYAARIQAEVARQGARARRESEELREPEREIENPVLQEIDALWHREVEPPAKADVARKARSRAPVE